MTKHCHNISMHMDSCPATSLFMVRVSIINTAPFLTTRLSTDSRYNVHSICQGSSVVSTPSSMHAFKCRTGEWDLLKCEQLSQMKSKFKYNGTCTYIYGTVSKNGSNYGHQTKTDVKLNIHNQSTMTSLLQPRRYSFETSKNFSH